MAQITWRNVANTVQGNPAAALGTAQASFSAVGRIADKQLEAAVARDELAANEATDDALQQQFGVGDLRGVDPGANFGEILKDYRAGKEGDSNIAQNAASIRRNNLLSDELAFNATPERRAEVAAREQSQDKREQTRLETDQTRLEVQQQRLAHDKDQWDAGITRANTVRDARSAAQRMTGEFETAGAADTDQFIADSMEQWVQNNPGATPEKLGKQQQTMSDARQGWIEDYALERIPDAYAQLIKDSNGEITVADLAGTDIGDAMTDARQLSRENQKKVYATAEKRRTRAATVAKSKNKLYNMGMNSDGTFTMLSESQADGNKLASADAVDTINSILTSRGIEAKDAGVDKDGQAGKILAKLGGNRDAFRSIFLDNSVVNSNNTILDDEIDWDAANNMADGYATAMRGSAENASKVAQGDGPRVSREEYSRRLASGTADAMFDPTTESATPEAKAEEIATSLQSDSADVREQSKSAAKELRTSLLDTYTDTITDETKSRDPYNSRKVADALRKAGIEVNGQPGKKVKDSDALLAALAEAEGFMKDLKRSQEGLSIQANNKQREQEFVNSLL